jgi:hypothetical protein
MSEDEPKKRKWWTILIAIVIIGIIGTVSGYYLYQNSLQPNIQVTAVNITPITDPSSSTVLDQGRVYTISSFSYTAILQGTYYLIFDNDFSWITAKSIDLTFFRAFPVDAYNSTFIISAGNFWYETIYLSEGQQVFGSFSISGGSGNDIDFRIQANTCTEGVTFACTLVNAGSSDGFATVVFTVDGSSVWSNQYFLLKGSSLPISGSITINNCESHAFNIIVQNQYKP